MNKVKRLIRDLPPWLFTIVTALLILWLTLVPRPLGDLNPPLFPGADKIVHAIMFGALTGSLIIDKERCRGWKRCSLAYIVFAVCVGALSGIVIEYVQDAMHLGRSFDELDMLADCVGSVLTGVLWYLIRLYFDGGKKES